MTSDWPAIAAGVTLAAIVIIWNTVQHYRNREQLKRRRRRERELRETLDTHFRGRRT